MFILSSQLLKSNPLALSHPSRSQDITRHYHTYSWTLGGLGYVVSQWAMEELGSQAEAQSSLRLIPAPGGQCSVGRKAPGIDLIQNWTDQGLAIWGCSPWAVAHRRGHHFLSVLCFLTSFFVMIFMPSSWRKRKVSCPAPWRFRIVVHTKLEGPVMRK